MSRSGRIGKVAMVETNCLDGLPHSRVSRTARVRERSDDDGSISLSKRPAKRRKAAGKGLDWRLSRMLNRANSALVADDASTAYTGRSRIYPHSFSSSVIDDAPKTPVENLAEHEGDRHHRITIDTRKSGQRSPIGKSSAASDVSPATSPARPLISSKRTRKAKSPRLLPPWLARTFTTLESAHPLRQLAEASNEVGLSREHHPTAIAPHGGILVGDEDLFAYMPPESPRDANNHVDIISHATSSDETLFEAHRQHSSTDHTIFAQPDVFFVPIDYPTETAMAKPLLTSPQPSSQQHFSQYRQTNDSHVSLGKDAEFLPFSTPGPACNFSNSTPALRKLLSLERDAFHEALLALDGNATPELVAHTTYEVNSHNNLTSLGEDSHDAALSGLSLLPTSDALYDTHLPFSTPGPVFCAPPVVYFDSPTEDPTDSDPFEPAYDDINADQRDACPQSARTPTTPRFGLQTAIHAVALSPRPGTDGSSIPPIVTLTIPTQERARTPLSARLGTWSKARTRIKALNQGRAFHQDRLRVEPTQAQEQRVGLSIRQKPRPEWIKDVSSSTSLSPSGSMGTKKPATSFSSDELNPSRSTLAHMTGAVLREHGQEQLNSGLGTTGKREVHGDEENDQLSQSSNDSIESWVM